MDCAKARGAFLQHRLPERKLRAQTGTMTRNDGCCHDPTSHQRQDRLRAHPIGSLMHPFSCVLRFRVCIERASKPDGFHTLVSFTRLKSCCTHTIEMEPSHVGCTHREPIRIVWFVSFLDPRSRRDQKGKTIGLSNRTSPIKPTGWVGRSRSSSDPFPCGDWNGRNPRDHVVGFHVRSRIGARPTWASQGSNSKARAYTTARWRRLSQKDRLLQRSSTWKR